MKIKTAKNYNSTLVYQYRIKHQYIVFFYPLQETHSLDTEQEVVPFSYSRYRIQRTAASDHIYKPRVLHKKKTVCF